MAGGWVDRKVWAELGREFRRARPRILARDPMCCSCHINASTSVDHIIPRSLGGTDADENLEGLCETCHAHKTALEGNAARVRRSNRRPPERHPGMR